MLNRLIEHNVPVYIRWLTDDLLNVERDGAGEKFVRVQAHFLASTLYLFDFLIRETKRTFEVDDETIAITIFSLLRNNH